jgi:hypothetical protein
MGEPYQPPTHKGELPAGDLEGGRVYTGSCHCGNVTLAVKTKPLDETYEGSVAMCNCSICERVSGHSPNITKSILLFNMKPWTLDQTKIYLSD